MRLRHSLKVANRKYKTQDSATLVPWPIQPAQFHEQSARLSLRSAKCSTQRPDDPAKCSDMCWLAEYKIQNAKYKIQNAKYKIQNTKYKIQYTKYKIQNTKFGIVVPPGIPCP